MNRHVNPTQKGRKIPEGEHSPGKGLGRSGWGAGRVQGGENEVGRGSARQALRGRAESPVP